MCGEGEHDYVQGVGNYRLKDKGVFGACSSTCVQVRAKAEMMLS